MNHGKPFATRGGALWGPSTRVPASGPRPQARRCRPILVPAVRALPNQLPVPVGRRRSRGRGQRAGKNPSAKAWRTRPFSPVRTTTPKGVELPSAAPRPYVPRAAPSAQCPPGLDRLRAGGRPLLGFSPSGGTRPASTGPAPLGKPPVVPLPIPGLIARSVPAARTFGANCPVCRPSTCLAIRAQWSRLRANGPP